MERWQEVADRVFVLHYRLFNQGIGVILGGTELLLVDTRNSHRLAHEILTDIAAIPGLRAGTVRHVVNTHRHSDHAFGNHVFRPASIWGHPRCASGLIVSADDDRRRDIEHNPELAEELNEVVIDPPDRTYEGESATIDVGGRPVELRHLGRGHTDGDTIVLVADAGVVFTGDLVVNDEPPYFGDSYPLEWPGTEEALARMAPAIVVPGHGSIVSPQFVRTLAADLTSMTDLARRAIHQGLTVDDVLPLAPWAGEARQGLERAMAHLEAKPETT
jgi:glyoxylase-like metal-dependent hydrolase (beta-lactamase superfamily II)